MKKNLLKGHKCSSLCGVCILNSDNIGWLLEYKPIELKPKPKRKKK